MYPYRLGLHFYVPHPGLSFLHPRVIIPNKPQTLKALSRVLLSWALRVQNCLRGLRLLLETGVHTGHSSAGLRTKTRALCTSGRARERPSRDAGGTSEKGFWRQEAQPGERGVEQPQPEKQYEQGRDTGNEEVRLGCEAGRTRRGRTRPCSGEPLQGAVLARSVGTHAL